MVIPTGESGRQALQLVIRSDKGYEVEELDAVSFVPFLSGRE